jgi:TetR/AcrR family transcriptional regulator, cholesterol catabolism regulator
MAAVQAAQSPKTRSARAQKTVDALLKSAREVLSETSYERASTAQIARRAGVSEGTLFLHFKNKLGLLSAMMHDFYTQLTENALAVRAQYDDAEQQLKHLLEHHLMELEQGWRYICVFAMHGRYRDDEFHDQFTQLNREYTRVHLEVFEQLKVQGVFKASVTPSVLRDTLFGSMEHFAMAHFSRTRSYDINAYLDELWTIVSMGAMNNEAQNIRLLEKMDQKIDRVISVLDSSTQT